MLLHCKRDELRKLWIEGIEHKHVLNLLDEIENIKQVPQKLEQCMASKHYLSATDMLVRSACAKIPSSLVSAYSMVQTGLSSPCWGALAIKKMPHTHKHRPTDLGHSPAEVLGYRVTPCLCQVDTSVEENSEDKQRENRGGFPSMRLSFLTDHLHESSFLTLMLLKEPCVKGMVSSLPAALLRGGGTLRK